MDLVEASVQVAQLRKSLQRGINPKLRGMRLGEWFDSCFLPSIERAGSRKTHKSRFDSHIRPVIGNRPVSQVTRGELVALVDALRPSPKCRRNIESIKPSTRNRVIDELKVIFRKLHDLELIEENPAKALRKLPERNQRMRILRDEEQARFLDALANTTKSVQLLVWLLILTGMRIGEALSARWEYVDFGSRILRLPDSKSGRPRVVPLSSEALAICEQLQVLRRNEWLFPGRGDQAMSRPGRQLNALIKEAGVEGLWIHDLRRGFATRVSECLPIHAVGALLGHTSSTTTERYLVAIDHRLHAATEHVGKHYCQLAPNIFNTHHLR